MEQTIYAYEALEITSSDIKKYVYYFGDHLNGYYMTIDLEDTDGFLSFMDWIEETYSSTIYDEINNLFIKILESDL